MKYKHYSPDCPVILFNNTLEYTLNIVKNDYPNYSKIGILTHSNLIITNNDNLIIYELGNDELDIMKNLYDGLRYLENLVDVIIIQSIKKTGVGVAIMNRLEKAASIVIS
jgi:L-threonylcarbamoyladenylate synthase